MDWLSPPTEHRGSPGAPGSGLPLATRRPPDSDYPQPTDLDDATRWPRSTATPADRCLAFSDNGRGAVRGLPERPSRRGETRRPEPGKARDAGRHPPDRAPTTSHRRGGHLPGLICGEPVHRDEGTFPGRVPCSALQTGAHWSGSSPEMTGCCWPSLAICRPALSRMSPSTALV